MKRTRRSELARKILLLFALTSWLSACATKWVEVGPPIDALTEQALRPAEDRDRLRLHVAGSEDATEGTLDGLSQDSVVLAQHREERATVATASVFKVEAERTNVPGLIALSVVSLAGLALFVAFVAAVVSLDDCNSGFFCENN
jgi:hypothetical protein